MEDYNSDPDGEIDVRGLIRSLLRYKWPILAITVGAALAVFLLFQFLIGKTYDASALVVFGSPSLNLAEGSAVTVNVSPASLTLPDPKGITDLAVVDDLALSVFRSHQLAESRQKGLDFAQFRKELDASISGNSQLLLRVTDADPQRAALIANLWAQAVANRVNSLYGSSDATVASLKQQTETAEQTWDAAEKSLSDHLSQSHVDLLSAQVSAQQLAYDSQLSRLHNIDALLSDGRALGGRFSVQPAGAVLSIGDALSLLALQQRANETFVCNAQPASVAVATPAVPSGLAPGSPSAPTFNCSVSSGMQVQLSSSDIKAGQSSSADASNALKLLTDALERQQTELKTGLAEADKDLPNLRAQLEAEQSQIDRLTTKRDLAKSAYEAASVQLSNMRVEASSATGQVARVAGRAAPPTNPSSRIAVYSIAAGVAAFVLAVFAFLFLDWWRHSPADTPNP